MRWPLNLVMRPSIGASIGLPAVVLLASQLGVAAAAAIDPNGALAADSQSYGLMIDAGSSGTRVYAYYWDHDKVTRSGIFAVHPLMNKSGKKQLASKIKPGLSTVQPANVAKYLQPLIQDALQYIPIAKHAETPLYLKATAGMRLLPAAQRDAVIDAAAAYLGDKSRVPFRFDSVYGAQVIPGESEALYGWMTVNALAGRLNKGQQSPPTSGAAGAQTVAALDLGGASTQVAFKPLYAPLSNSYRVHINRTSHVIYAQSYLRFGMNAAHRRYTASLVRQQNATAPPSLEKSTQMLRNPCGIRNMQSSATLETGQVVQTLGTGQFAECRAIIRSSLLGLDSFCATTPCAVNGVYMPDMPADMPIYATSNYFEISDILDVAGSSSISRLLDRAQDKCTNLDASSAASGLPKAKDDIGIVCFAAALIVELLTAYRIPAERQIHFVEKLSDRSTDWTLGAMIDMVNEIYMTT
ncbi:nucleoside phosphatase GDA1/CD39 [Thamnocephalis sphaerospora]|uniref:guanosine-diphosphatase n=1 Tax=Thamnocephalis sphaerospora TaxID=78915 RepID=A0A4P9XQM8_9FUNG|nr:nucleoside phosphatase GDA1/CD39 [Thamnocephalis sphaerospora]|eukprot:RKP08354.1 nucleoside phosphatase GDA1/CD39 [Thamnocephalis sphaerospora]